ncbi:MAG TPA: radical SAM family heme chaperone HemW [Terriglobales bacterium]|nr:radical SAM family heme chaperone HemW [Terriglobales bacterium]
MEQMPVGIYVSVPFCRAKCSYCNFASGVFSAARMDRYVDRLAEDITAVRSHAASHHAELPSQADTIYLGGGTPSILAPQQMERLFATIRNSFDVAPNSEITIECAPGQISDAMLDLFPRLGVNRVSLGMQSFIDQEARAVGRMHTKAITLKDIERLRAAGISDINLDLIAGLPHQTPASWNESVQAVIATGVPHVSVYMLEVDDDSRLGRELIAGGTRYHAHHVPEEDLIADLYISACETLEAAGIHQYEISNFARPGHESLHNLKYWTRQPYIGFGLDAHSMLLTETGAIRFSATDDFEKFFNSADYTISLVTPGQAMEEEFFLGLRLNRGVDLAPLRGKIPAFQQQAISSLLAEALLEKDDDRICLTSRGRLLSNDVFARFLAAHPTQTFA